MQAGGSFAEGLEILKADQDERHAFNDRNNWIAFVVQVAGEGVGVCVDVVGNFHADEAVIKSDRNAAPIEFGMYKFNLELLADGSPVMVSVFLDAGIKAEEFAAKVQIKRGDVVAVAVNKLELKNGVRRASCGMANFVVLEKTEVEQLRS